MNPIFICRWCGSPLGGKQTDFCSASCKISNWRRETKLWAVALLGGACQRCGYKKCIAALVFHHKNGKVFGFARKGIIRSRAKLEEELRKCELLCLCCHAEEHHPD